MPPPSRSATSTPSSSATTPSSSASPAATSRPRRRTASTSRKRPSKSRTARSASGSRLTRPADRRRREPFPQPVRAGGGEQRLAAGGLGGAFEHVGDSAPDRVVGGVAVSLQRGLVLVDL